MTTTLDIFKKFMADEEAWDMYISGYAGTGKTTELKHEVQYCIDNNIEYLVCAYTHKACDVLQTKLPEGATIATLHSFLKKRPTINQHATNVKHLQSNKQHGVPTKPKVIFIDEYSMIGEKDGMDIRAAQDPEYEGAPDFKVVWIGDPNQLDPVGDMSYVIPDGDYQVRLTKVRRTKDDNPLRDVITQLINMLEGTEQVSALKSNPNFIRGQDLVQQYGMTRAAAEACDVADRLNVVCLAYTNQRVEELNALIEGTDTPYEGAQVFSPGTKQAYKFIGFVDKPSYIDTPFNGEVHLGSKYQTLEHLIKSKMCQFAELETPDGLVITTAVIFGHYQYKLKSDELKAEAAKSNKEIETANRGYKAAAWAKHNPKTKLARARAKAWRDFMCFDECVMCIDFTHAMTVHKSQGSTYDTVFLDTEDLYKCARINPTQYLKLMYVAISRASNQVITN